jgi:hypothetical protein
LASYLLVLIFALSLCSLGAFLVHHDKLMSFENEICLLSSITFSMLKKCTGPCLTKGPHLFVCGIFSISSSQDFHFLLGTYRNYLSNKISFISIGVSFQKSSKFFTGGHL